MSSRAKRARPLGREGAHEAPSRLQPKQPVVRMQTRVKRARPLGREGAHEAPSRSRDGGEASETAASHSQLSSDGGAPL